MTKKFANFRRNVAREAKRLDTSVPDWHKVIDLNSLDLWSSYDCVLGQLQRAGKFPNRHTAANGKYFNFLDSAFWGTDHKDGDVPNEIEKQVWGKEIDKRKALENRTEITIRLTRDDFRKAVKESRKGVGLISNTCAVALGARRAIGPNSFAGAATFGRYPLRFIGDSNFRHAVNLFDNNYMKLSGDKIYKMAKALNLLEIKGTR